MPNFQIAMLNFDSFTGFEALEDLWSTEWSFEWSYDPQEMQQQQKQEYTKIWEMEIINERLTLSPMTKSDDRSVLRNAMTGGGSP